MRSKRAWGRSQGAQGSRPPPLVPAALAHERPSPGDETAVEPAANPPPEPAGPEIGATAEIEADAALEAESEAGPESESEPEPEPESETGPESEAGPEPEPETEPETEPEAEAKTATEDEAEPPATASAPAVGAARSGDLAVAGEAARLIPGLAVVGVVLGLWAIAPNFTGPTLVLQDPSVEIVDHVVPGVAVLVASVVALAVAWSRPRPEPVLFLTGATVAAAGLWMVATHVPLLLQAVLGDAPWSAALYHLAPSVAVLWLGLAWTVRYWSGWVDPPD